MTSRMVTSIVVAACVALPGSVLAQAGAPRDSVASDSTRAIAEKQAELEERLEALEAAKKAHEEATRRIIREALDKTGSQINQSVTLGGTFEMGSAYIERITGGYEGVLALNTLEFDFEIAVTPWTLGSVILQYDDGSDYAFVSTEGDERSINRINVDTATLTIGDTYRVVPYVTAGRMIVPFGISTGDPVADVLTLEDPLTIEVFETKEDAVMIGLAFPTPARTTLPPRREPPPVRPKVLNPLVGGISRLLGYRPPPTPAAPPALVTPATPPPPLHAAVIFFRGDTFTLRHQNGWRPQAHIGATLGFRNRWLEADVDYTTSIFDTRFLEYEYRTFLRQIGLVPGMAGTVRLSLGPFPIVGEWNGSINPKSFRDDLGRKVTIRPRAWQVSVGYQLGWNKWVKSSGMEGTYLAVGYSESEDLAGVTRVIDGTETRVGDVPERRYLAHAAEWIWPGVRLAFEYSRIVDYDKNRGGTGRQADAFVTALTYEW